MKIMRLKLYYNEQCIKTLYVRKREYTEFANEIYNIKCFNKKHLLGNIYADILVKACGFKYYKTGTIDTFHLDVNLVEGVRF